METPPTKRQKAPPPPVPEGWDRCHAYMDRKSRFCRQEVLPALTKLGYFFCGNHRHLCPESVEATRCSDRLRRIPCPIDPTHHIYEHMLEKHIPKCPKTVALEKQKLESYYCQDCNCGGHGSDRRSIDQDQKLSGTDVGEVDNEQACRVALAVLRAYQRLFLMKEKRKTGIGTVPAPPVDVTLLSGDDIFKAIPMFNLAQREHNRGFKHDVYDNRIKCGGWRHMNQQASLIGNLRRVGAVEDFDFERATNAKKKGSQSNQPYFSRLIIEMGAGRGMTGLILAGVSGRNEHVHTHLTMIERGTSRSRADKSLHRIQVCTKGYIPGYTYLDLSAVHCDRIQCDVSHIDMKWVLKPNPCDTVDLLLHPDASTKAKREVIVIAKHLCGVGTDLALKALQPVKDEITACIMATCCHGVCSWKDYVGRDFLMEAMLFDTTLLTKFGEAEFDLLRLWSSGTVKDHRSTNDEDEHSQPTRTSTESNDPTELVNVTKIVKALKLRCGVQGFGRACQRLIDFGRCEYMRQELFCDTKIDSFNVELIHYVPVEDTLQNAALFAYRRGTSS